MKNIKAHLPKIIVIILLLADIVLAYPVYSEFMKDPLEDMPAAAPSAVTTKKKVVVTDTEVKKVGRPPRGLFAWNPFEEPEFLKEKVKVVDAETQTQEAPGELPIVTDNIRILGIVNLGGKYRALISYGAGPVSAPTGQGGQGAAPSAASSGDPAIEIVEGSDILEVRLRRRLGRPPTPEELAAEEAQVDDLAKVTVVKIERNKILLQQPGRMDTELKMKSDVETRTWFKSMDGSRLRGGVGYRQ